MNTAAQTTHQKQSQAQQQIEEDDLIDAWKKKMRDEALYAFVNSEHYHAVTMMRFAN